MPKWRAGATMAEGVKYEKVALDLAEIVVDLNLKVEKYRKAFEQIDEALKHLDNLVHHEAGENCIVMIRSAMETCRYS
jgi:hypothetical protein